MRAGLSCYGISDGPLAPWLVSISTTLQAESLFLPVSVCVCMCWCGVLVCLLICYGFLIPLFSLFYFIFIFVCVCSTNLGNVLQILL